MTNYRISDEDFQVIDMICEHYGYWRNSRARSYMMGWSRKVLWAELDKLTRP